ncbi:MAG: glycosyl hydrolase family 8 [Bacteroidaceae bacterium]|nr:glycosyl hydrolase family 8 [Bacteroidaceae bacterium]
MKKLIFSVIALMMTTAMSAQNYRNLFKEAGHSQKEIDKKVEAVFDSLFFGKDRIYFEVGDSMGYVSDLKNHDVRTEGMSYGLMVAVQLDKKDIFDRIWRWGKKYMQMENGYFGWSIQTDGSRRANGPASDGELYYITSLLFASNRWGNDTGINYLKEAQYLLDIIQPKEVTMPSWGGRPARTVKQSLIDPTTNLITFVPGANYTDPSYHLPVFYEIWAKYGQDGRSDYWMECAKASRAYMHKSVHPETGLNPDYNNYDGSLMNSRGIIGDCFRYDSWRVPMNMTLDYTWSGGKDAEWQKWYTTTIQRFFYNQGIDTFVDQFNVDGTTPERILSAGGYTKLRHSLGLVSTLAAASIVSDHPNRMDFVDRVWNSSHQPYEDGYYDAYYDGLLRLFSFMHLSGKYRIIEPSKAAKTSKKKK